MKPSERKGLIEALRASIERDRERLGELLRLCTHVDDNYERAVSERVRTGDDRNGQIRSKCTICGIDI